MFPFSLVLTCVAFDLLGKSGFVAINNSDSPWNATLNTGLPKGSYCDVVSGGAKASKCTGPT